MALVTSKETVPKWETQMEDSVRARVSLVFSANLCIVTPNTEILWLWGNTYVEVSHDQESERRLPSVVVEGAKHGRAVQNERRSAEAAAASGIFQAPQGLSSCSRMRRPHSCLRATPHDFAASNETHFCVIGLCAWRACMRPGRLRHGISTKGIEIHRKDSEK